MSFEAALQRAIDKANADVFPIEREFMDEKFTFYAHARTDDRVMEIVGNMQRLAKTPEDANVEETRRSIGAFLEVMLTPDSYQLVLDLTRGRAMDISDGSQMINEIMERVAARPFTKPSPSASGLPVTGTSSPDGASPAPSTPQPWPSTT